MTESQAPPPATPPPATLPPDTSEAGPTRSESLLRDILSSSWVMTLAAIVLALVIGAVLVIAADPDVQAAAVYFFARPADFLAAAWDAVFAAYSALLQGAIVDWQATSFQRAVRPITETMTISVPLILAGLGIGIGFRSGLFNIGAQGQMILGAILASYLGFTLQLPGVLHVFVALVGAAVGGAVWAGIAGVLKARTGAHEVIVTIMLNNIAVYLVLYVLTLRVFESGTPQVAKPVRDSAMLPLLLGPGFRLHLGFVLALLAAVGVWWLMERSVLGFRFRAVGSNANAARTAGISVAGVTVAVMAIAGALAGLGGGMQLLGTERNLTGSIAGTVGFDAITVALLGRSKPLGTVLAGLLFGAFAAGGRLMQTRTGTPIDLVLVLQSLIVLFIAAPPLVRSVFRLPAPGARRRSEALA
ncbi:inner-membrane translocator [Beutenbergia cavernae DSM 12333]|uniref:Inner-membrane translocator n=1 Tax=Beutenbergia cavernae (strain ATCC BAA-8 / DSM 12333 / CCUG 43141 / JCM 11478 / NBRC 16432 / NCIMB 13614 / HKI 0122) TaxID=471853 RepID=C5BZ75_BEUC1|nr:ABC transporter permease [Beutenbergia cavernae]ACQ81190.1 inner-membrane translocator [Beutenbergia cavernae DSM 12333]